MTAPRPHGECWCCGRPGPVQASGRGEGLCHCCANRWHVRGWQGPGPGPGFTPQAERARDHAGVITSLSARQAADRLGVSARTVIRWRRALAGAA